MPAVSTATGPENVSTLLPTPIVTSSKQVSAAVPVPESSHRVILQYCLPALLVGLALRIVLRAYMPRAFYSPDTNEFFASHLIGGSRTFLPKLIYGAPGRLGIPFLPFVAIFQHLLGLVSILAAGYLAAKWLCNWRWWIVPLTILMAIQPTLLWYEHFALPDSTFALMVMLVCLAGFHFSEKPGSLSFGLLFGALFLAAGARQEGFLFLVFGVAVVARAFWREWKKFCVFVPLALVLSVGIARLCKTSQGGYMLLTSLIHFAPDRLWSEPALSARVQKLREHFKPLWPAYPDDHNKSRKLIISEVEDHLRNERGIDEDQVRETSSAIYQRLAMEIALRNFWRMPVLAFHKIPRHA